jgi:arabinofuranosyltransferase
VSRDRRQRPAPVAAGRAASPAAGGRPLALALLALAVAVFVAGAIAAWPRTVDDAYITYRYSENLATGHGPIFNPGERVEGYSSPSWMALLASAIAVKADPELVSKLLGVLASLLLLGAVFLALRRAGVEERGAALATVPLGASYVLQLWSVAGLETNAYTLLFFAGAALLALEDPAPRAALAASGLLTAAAFTRPEGVAFWGLGLVVVAISRRADRARALGFYVLPGLALAAHVLWRLRYYGEPFPNTYYAKAGGGAAMWGQGLFELEGFVFQGAHAAWILAAAWGAALALRVPGRRRFAGLLAGAALFHVIYVVSVGGDGLYIHRFYVPVLPILAALAGLLFLPAADRTPVPAERRVFAVLALALTAVASVWSLAQWAGGSAKAVTLTYQEGNVRLGRALSALPNRALLVAVEAAGAIPYYSKLRVIDMFGLNDSVIAHRPFPAAGRERMLKWDNDYVLSRSPDVIVINRGYFRAGDPNADAPAKNAGFLAVSAIDRDLFPKVAATRRYAISRVPFEDGASFWIFVRVPAAPDSGRAAPGAP